MNSDRKLSRRIQNLVPLLVMLTLALLVLVPAPAGAVDKFVIGDRVEVSAASNNVRDAPAGTIIGSHPQGALGTVDAGPVVANNITWWRINYDTGMDGWSGEDLLTKFVGPPPSDKFVIGDRVQVSAATANARDAPAGTINGSHPQGALGTVVAGPVLAGVTWWRIDYDTGADGWTGEDRLTKFVGPEPPPPPPPPPDKFVIGDRVEVSAAAINVRNAPAGTLIGSQPQGVLGTVVAGPVVAGPHNITWWRINYDTGTDGWSGQDLLTKFVGPEPPPPPPPPDKFVIGDRVEVSAAAINVRNAPAGTRIGSQPQGALGTVVAGPVVAGPNNLTWWRINYDTGTNGWSGENNLTKFGEPPLSTTADLALSLTGTPAFLTVNGQLTYTITVENSGPGTATGVQVVDSLPPEALQLGPPDSSQGECRGTVRVDCDLRTLAAGAEATVTINVIPTVTGVLSNAAHVTAFQSDPNAANNSSTETTTVEPSDPAEADLAITAAVDPRASGQGFTYTLIVKNDGPATATGVQLTNDLPGGIVLDQSTASQGNCSGTDPMLCTLGTLTSGAEAIVTIDVIRTEVGTLPNRAAVNGEQHDPNTTNNFALTSAVDLPTSQTTCNSTRCRLRLTCNLSGLLGRSCENQVTLFVDARARRDTRARRLSDERAVRPPKLVRFAAVVRNFPGGQTQNVPLKLTRKGKKLARKLVMQGKKKLRGGILQIRNAPGGTDGTDTIPLTLRLR